MSQQIASIERATLAAVPPSQTEEIPGWLMALDRGTVGRAHSAVPLAHGIPKPGVAALIAHTYAMHGLSAVYRLPRIDAFDDFRADLVQAGFKSSKPTLTQIGDVLDMSALTPVRPGQVEVSPTPGADWGEIFLGEGFDPVDGASRLEVLRRARNSVFASIYRDGRVAAVGSACFDGGWAGVNGMRTAPAYRGKGLASLIMAELAWHARERGISRAFLQVEETNKRAQALYKRAGFATAWTSEYWRAD